MDSLVCRGKEARHRRRAREQRAALRAREPVVALPHEHVDEAGEIGLRWGVVRMIAEALTPLAHDSILAGRCRVARPNYFPET